MKTTRCVRMMLCGFCLVIKHFVGSGIKLIFVAPDRKHQEIHEHKNGTSPLRVSVSSLLTYASSNMSCVIVLHSESLLMFLLLLRPAGKGGNEERASG